MPLGALGPGRGVAGRGRPHAQWPCCRASEASAKRHLLWPSFLSCVSEAGASGSRGVRGREAQAEGPRRPVASEQRRGRLVSVQEPFRVEQEPFGCESLAWKPGEHHRAEKGPGTARVAVPGRRPHVCLCLRAHPVPGPLEPVPRGRPGLSATSSPAGSCAGRTGTDSVRTPSPSRTNGTVPVTREEPWR